MVESSERLTRADLDRIALLHVASIDDSIPTMLGASYARAFFASLVESPFEHLLLERVEGRIESVCVVSVAPESVYLRTARATLPRLVGSAGLALFRSTRFQRFVRCFVIDLLRGTAGQTHAPEITYIFTSAERRSLGLGRRLVERVECLLAARGATSCYVRTVDESWYRALNFYRTRGFRQIQRVEEGGRPFAVFQKDLGLPASAAA